MSQDKLAAEQLKWVFLVLFPVVITSTTWPRVSTSLLLSFAALGNGNLTDGPDPTQDHEFRYKSVFCKWLCTHEHKDSLISIL